MMGKICTTADHAFQNKILWAECLCFVLVYTLKPNGADLRLSICSCEVCPSVLYHIISEDMFSCPTVKLDIKKTVNYSKSKFQSV